MSRAAARVTQKEVENAVRGFEAAGKRVAEMRVLPDGTIVVSSEFAAARETVPPSIVDALLDEAEHGAR
jgi:hypothetical protein